MFGFSDHIFKNYLNTYRLYEIDRENDPTVKVSQKVELGNNP